MKPEEIYERIKRRLEQPDQHTLNEVGDYVDMLFGMLQAAREDARTDHLTQLPNYKGLIEILERETSHARRYNEPLTLGFVDFNDLKRYNDTYGHPQTNHAIQKVSQIIKSSLRPEDTLARYGGDEFCLVLPHTNLDGSKKVADKIVQSVDSLLIDWVVPESPPDQNYKRIFVSIGLSELHPNETHETLISRANTAMRSSKNSNQKDKSSIVYL